MEKIIHSLTMPPVGEDSLTEEDGGQYVSFNVWDDKIQVCISSYDEEADNDENNLILGHEFFRKLLDRKLKITIETID